jgi:hypothetical protein
MKHSKINSQFSILNFPLVFFFALILILSACSQTTSNKYGSLTGSVVLTNDSGDPDNNPVDYAGVTVALYHKAVLDADITALNASHPDIGVLISQQTEFDHRLQNPVKVATTVADGSFSISKISPGKYNLVIMKEGWGVRYLYDINITEGDNTLSSKNSQFSILNAPFKRSVVELFPITELSGYISNSFEFKANHNYLVTDDATFTADVIISPSSNIWIAPNKKMKFYADLTSPDSSVELARISSSDAMYNTTSVISEDIQRFYSIECSNTVTFNQNKLGSISTSFSESGWSIATGNLTISIMVIKNCRIGMQLTNVNNIAIANCNIRNSSDPELGAVTLIGSDNINTSNLVVKDCTIGIRQHTCGNANISNCYFCDNTIKDVMNIYETIGSIEHCVFKGSSLSIETSGASNTSISYCEIQSNFGIFNTWQNNWQASTFTANYNNFDCTQYCVKTKATYSNASDIVYYNCENNYWNTTSASEIESKIWDRNDEDVNDPDYYLFKGVVDYIPYRTSQVPNAGLVDS